MAAVVSAPALEILGIKLQLFGILAMHYFVFLIFVSSLYQFEDQKGSQSGMGRHSAMVNPARSLRHLLAQVQSSVKMVRDSWC